MRCSHDGSTHRSTLPPPSPSQTNQAAAAEAKAGELRAALEKAEAERALAVKDREQAYESLSRTAVALQEHKVCDCVWWSCLV